jgi:hypothetical protein
MVQKDTFILLSPTQWAELEKTYVISDFTPHALARCMMHLVEAVGEWGRAACARQDRAYPFELEKVSAGAVQEFYALAFELSEEDVEGE